MSKFQKSTEVTVANKKDNIKETPNEKFRRRVLFELEHTFELSPKLRELKLNTAKECLLRDHTLKE